MLPVLAFTASAALASTGGGASTPRNCLMIVMDDVGPELLGCYETWYRANGRPAGVPARTPAIDTLLAAQGVSFANAWTAPSCTPSRAQILTGRHGFRTGMGKILDENGAASNPGLALQQTLLPELLHSAPQPYACAAVGKWHLADRFQLATDLRHALGSPPGTWFDRYAGSLFNFFRLPGLPPEEEGYFAWTKAYASAVQVGVDPCSPGGPPCERFLTVPPIENYATVDTVDDALAVLGELPEPWFVYVAFNAVHEPVHDGPWPLPGADCGDWESPLGLCLRRAPFAFATRVRCMLEALDGQVGRLLCAVDPTDTVVIAVGDNGTAKRAVLPPYDSRHGKFTMYEGGVNVPLIVRSPDLAPALAGTVSDRLVSSTDLFATVAEIAGVAPQAIVAEDSISLVPFLAGQASVARETIYTERFDPNFTPDPTTALPPPGYQASSHEQALRNARWKLIRRWQRDALDPSVIAMTEEAFDLTQGGPPDPGSGLATPDHFEAYELLSAGPLSPVANAEIDRLRATLDAFYPPLVQ